MKKNYAAQVKEIIEQAPLSQDSAAARFVEMAEFLDKNFPAIKTTPKTIPYPPPVGYGSLGKDVTEAVLCEANMI